MATYALLLTFSGFSFDMTQGRVRFRPIMQPGKPFRCFWALDRAWGNVHVSAEGFRLEVVEGFITLRMLDLPSLDGAEQPVRVAGAAGERLLEASRRGDTFILAEDLNLDAGDDDVRADLPVRARLPLDEGDDGLHGGRAYLRDLRVNGA